MWTWGAWIMTVLCGKVCVCQSVVWGWNPAVVSEASVHTGAMWSSTLNWLPGRQPISYSLSQVRFICQPVMGLSPRGIKSFNLWKISKFEIKMHACDQLNRLVSCHQFKAWIHRWPTVLVQFHNNAIYQPFVLAWRPEDLNTRESSIQLKAHWLTWRLFGSWPSSSESLEQWLSFRC